jgi:hemin uptake protein HemP
MQLMNQAPAPKSAIPPCPPLVSAAALLGESKELLIEHGSERYRLSLTRNGKLILTK